MRYQSSGLDELFGAALLRDHVTKNRHEKGVCLHLHLAGNLGDYLLDTRLMVYQRTLVKLAEISLCRRLTSCARQLIASEGSPFSKEATLEEAERVGLVAESEFPKA